MRDQQAAHAPQLIEAESEVAPVSAIREDAGSVPTTLVCTGDHLSAHICWDEEATCIDCGRPSEDRLCNHCYLVNKL